EDQGNNSCTASIRNIFYEVVWALKIAEGMT
ncbi:MAG: hypothetical protein ACI9K1_000943, partial [Arcticibacterium sp.]